MTSDGQKVGGEYGDVRASIDVSRLNGYFARHVPAIKVPVDVKQFKFGQSNPTYLLSDISGRRFVLRKKPAGKLISKTAHQIEREYTMLAALHRHNNNPATSSEHKIPIPEPFTLCDDSSIIGTPFYVMEYLDGRIFTEVSMPGISAKHKRECWMSGIRSLAALSSLDPSALGLTSLSSPTPYFPRQIKSLSRVSVAQSEAVDVDTGKQTGEIPEFNDMVRWYSSHLPDERKTGGLRIVHGDYKLDNIIFHPTEPRVIGILDWELTTLGSPLQDLANFTMPWSFHALNVPMKEVDFLPAVKFDDEPPLPLEELEREFCARVNHPYPIKEMVFARSWSFFRLAVISQGIAARYYQRQASSEKAHLHVSLFPMFGTLARKTLESEGYDIHAVNAKL